MQIDTLRVIWKDGLVLEQGYPVLLGYRQMPNEDFNLLPNLYDLSLLLLLLLIGQIGPYLPDDAIDIIIARPELMK